MSSSIRDFVMSHPLMSHHDHHRNFVDFEAGRATYGYRQLLGYAEADLRTAEGARPAAYDDECARLAALWPKIRTTGYGRAVALGTRALFDVDYAPANFEAITEALQAAIRDRTAAEVYEFFVGDKANNRWVMQDGWFREGNEGTLGQSMYPENYRFAWRWDGLFSIANAEPVNRLAAATGADILSLDDFVAAMNAHIDIFRGTGRMAAFKVGIAYQRDLVVKDPPRTDAERAFNTIRNTKTVRNGLQQNDGAVNAVEARPLGDYMLHQLLRRASDEDVPVQIHTGYLAGNWGALAGTRAIHLVPLFEKYRRVRFDIFHASWPWVSELGCLAKEFPNVHPDLCWAWTMNPAESRYALSQWLDAVPFNKIFGYGADTGFPWCNVGYSIQARRGISAVLEEKIAQGSFSEETAQEVAAAIMVGNGEAFYGLSG